MRNRRHKKVDFVETAEGCFECTSHSQTGHGYINFQRNHRKVALHRYIFEECFGEVPEGQLIRHKCDNRKCINPEHLELGTPQDNTQDMLSRNRSGRTALTIETVQRIKFLLESDAPYSEIAEICGTTIRIVKRIESGETWKNV